MLLELQIINRLRLEHDWSWHQLAAVMAQAGVRLSSRTLHYLVKHEERQALILDRTLFKLRTFLAWARDQDGLLSPAMIALLPDALKSEGDPDDAPILRAHHTRAPERRRRTDTARLR